MGGVQYSSYYLLKELQTYNNINPILLLPGKGTFSKLCEKNNIPYKIYISKPYMSTSITYNNDRLRFPNPIAWFYNLFSIIYNGFQIKSILKHFNKSIVLSKGLSSHFTTSIACRNMPNQLIWHLQDLISNRLGGILIYIINWIAQKSPDHITCDGVLIQQRLDLISQMKSTVILNGLDTSEFQRDVNARMRIRKEFDIQKNAYVIGHVGRITPWKGQKYLLDAFIQYSKINSNAYLCLVGSHLFDNDQYYKSLIEIISKNNLNKKVVMPGYRTDLNSMFSAMDLLIYPSIEKDTSPLALLSAMVSGVPVAFSNINSLNEISEIIPDMLSFNPLDPNEITEIISYFEDSSIRQKYGKIIQKNSVEHFSIKSHTEKLVKILISHFSKK